MKLTTMKARSVGRLSGLLVLLAVVAGAAEVSRLVHATVMVSGAASRWRHEVTIANKGERRRVVSVLLGQDSGLPVEPKELSAPSGWSVKTEERFGARGPSWAVQFTCDWSAGRSRGAHVPEDGEVPCGIKAGESVKFQVTLPYRWEELERQRLLVGFSDGRLGVAS